MRHGCGKIVVASLEPGAGAVIQLGSQGSVAQPGKAIVAYDQDKWAAAAKYDATPIELSLATFTAARQWTVSLLRKFRADLETVISTRS